MNLEWMKAGYPASVTTIENRLVYFEAFDQWVPYGNSEPFIDLISPAILDGFKLYQIVVGV